MAFVFVFFAKSLTGLVEPCFYLLSAHLFTFSSASPPPVEIRTRDPSKRAAADRAATGIGKSKYFFYKTW